MKVSDIFQYLVANPEPPKADIAENLRHPELYVKQAIIPCLDLLRLESSNYVAASEKEALEMQLAQFYRTMADHARQVYAKEHRAVNSVPRFIARQDLKDALSLFFRNVERHRREQGAKALTFTGSNLQPLEQFLKACTGAAKETDLAILAHFCWQVKRKMNGLKVVYHTMPILYGVQGGGKSEAINRLIGPFHELGYVLTSSVKSLADDRYQKMLSEKLIAFADEMAYAAMADIESLKNIISANVLTPRKLGTNDSFMLQQNCTFIGASNKAVNEIFYDPTGMRRFYEVKCQPRLDWSLINAIDYTALWRGIDEGKTDGYLVGPIKLQIEAEQEKLTEKDDISLFIEDEFLVACKDGSSFISNPDLYGRFRTFVERELGGHSKVSPRGLIKRLANMGYPKSKKTVYGKTTKGFSILFSEDEARHQAPNSNVVNLKKE